MHMKAMNARLGGHNQQEDFVSNDKKPSAGNDQGLGEIDAQ